MKENASEKRDMNKTKKKKRKKIKDEGDGEIKEN